MSKQPILIGVMLCACLAAGCNVTGQVAKVTPAPLPLTALAATTAALAAVRSPMPQASQPPAEPPMTREASALVPSPAATLSPPSGSSATIAPSATADPPPTARPTATAQPASTPTPSITLSPSPTAEPSPTPGPSPTPAAIATLLAGEPPRVRTSLPSPDGRYRAEVLVYGCESMGEEGDGYDLLRVVETAGGAAQFIADQYRVCMGLGGAGLDALFWDETGRFLYFTPAREGGADGGCAPSQRPLLRADATDWSVTPLGGAVTSPDGERFAGWQGRELLIGAFDEVEIARVAPVLPYPELGMPAWSPDGAAIAYLQGPFYFCFGAGAVAVVVDTATLASRVLLDLGDRVVQSIRWVDGATLLLENVEGGAWLLDLVTGELSEAP